MRSAKVAALLIVLATVALATANSNVTAGGETAKAEDNDGCETERCEFNRDRRKLRRNTSRNPIPSYIVGCESGGSYTALNRSSMAGGKYQIIPSTWRAYLPSVSRRHIKLAEDVMGKLKNKHIPDYAHQASPLLQDIVAGIIWRNDGPGAWSCA